MRRLWAYIILAFTALATMGTTFANVFKQSTSNIEYSDGKQLVFRVSEKDGSKLEGHEDDETSPAEEIADIIVDRLSTYDISTYEVEVQGEDTVSVTVKQQTEANYDNIKELVTFNGSFALSSKLDNFLSNSLTEEKFIDGDAYVKTENDYPTVNIPVDPDSKFSELLKQVKTYSEEENTDAAEESTSGEGDDAETTYTYYLYLWKDYDADTDIFSKTVEGNDDYDSRIAEKILMKFDVSQIEDDADVIKAYVNINDTNGNEKYEASEVRASYDTARHYVNLLNCESLDYKVTFLYDENVAAFADELVTVDGIVNWSSTLRATVCAIVILALLLAVFYRLGALSVGTLTLGSVFAGVASIILFTAEFNAAGLVALCLVALASLISGVIYLNKLKEEAYRGRSLKKANSEAAKKSLLPIVDINVVLIIMGVFSYVFGSTIMRTFAIITVLGGLASLILNTLGLRGMMWLATNTTKLQGKYDAFGIDSKKVPNVLKEEKQTYFGPYADKDFTTKKKPIGIVAAVLAVAGLAGMIALSVINKGVVYNNGSEVRASEIYFETDSKDTLMNEEKVTDILKNVYTYTNSEEKATDLYSQVDEILYKTREDIGDDEDDVINYSYYVVRLTTKLDNTSNSYYVEKDADGNEIGSREYALVKDQKYIADLLQEKITLVDSAVEVDLKTVKLASTVEPEFAPIVWGTLVGIAVSAFYLLLRYRLSRGIAAFIVPTMVTTIVAGFFAYTRFAVTNYAAVTIPVVAAFSLFISIIFMNREREMVLDDKTHDKSIENRDSIMKKANSLAYSPIIVATVLALYLGINFFGFGAEKNSWLFLIITVGVLVATLFGTTLFGPTAQAFYKLFSKVNTEKIANKFKKKKKKATKVNKSAEPEERIFIGIND